MSTAASLHSPFVVPRTTARSQHELNVERSSFDVLMEGLLRKYDPAKRQAIAERHLVLHADVTWKHFWEVFDATRTSMHGKSHEHRLSVVSRECHKIATYR